MPLCRSPGAWQCNAAWTCSKCGRERRGGAHRHDHGDPKSGGTTLGTTLRTHISIHFYIIYDLYRFPLFSLFSFLWGYWRSWNLDETFQSLWSMILSRNLCGQMSQESETSRHHVMLNYIQNDSKWYDKLNKHKYKAWMRTWAADGIYGK